MTSSRALAVLDQLNNKDITEEQVLETDYFLCRYIDKETDSLSSDGCEVVGFSTNSFTCECTHLTSFLSFFDKGVSVLQDSNYDVWLALPLITISSLKTNIGFYIACAYWGSLFLLGMFAMNSDRKHLKGRRLKLLYEISHPSSSSEELDKTFESDASVYPVETFDGKTAFTERRKSHSQMENREITRKRENAETTRARRERQHLDDSVVIGSDIDVRTRR